MFHLSRLVVQYHDQSFALFHGYLYRLLQSVINAFLDSHAVDDHLDVVVLVAVHFHAAHYLVHLAVDADVEIALATHRLKQLAVVALAAAHQGSQNQNFPARIVVGYQVDDFLLGVFHHRLARDIAVGTSGAGIEQTHVVVDLSGGTYRGTGILIGGFLLDADDGRQSGYLVNVGTFHTAQKVAGIGRERLDIAALPLGKDGVEGQTRLARTAQSGYHRQRVARYLNVDVLEVMYARPPYIYLIVVTHCLWWLFR